MLIKLCIQDGFWVARPKRRKESKSIHWFQKQVKLKNAAKITLSGGVLDGWAEISKSNQTYPLASKSNKVEGMVIKSCILDGFWAARPNRRKVNQSIHWLQKQVKLKECWQNDFIRCLAHNGPKWKPAREKQQKHTLVSKSHKIEEMLIKSCVPRGFWAGQAEIAKSKQEHPSIGFKIKQN